MSTIAISGWLAAIGASWSVVDQALDLAGDTGTDTYNTSETLTFAGGSGMQAVVTDNTVTINATGL
ncbi:MAG: hypothetical protein MJK04_03670, partial [Psychrosphaera sp.]|nr:hypothetical protein [Psychrosphaera sp.]